MQILNAMNYAFKNNIDIILYQDPHVIYNGTGKLFSHLPQRWINYFSTTCSLGIIITNRNIVHLLTKALENSGFINITLQEKNNIIIGSKYSAISKNLEKDLQEWTDVFENTGNLMLFSDFSVHIRL